MRLLSKDFTDGDILRGEFAFCIPHERNHVCLGANRNPQLAWSDLPAGTRSLVLICHDPDVPSAGDAVNKEGMTVSATLPRIDFFHWVLIDLPPSLGEIAAGSFSDDVVPRGKSGPQAAHGSRQGVNDYTAWFAGDADMRGDYYGYDGPCPPWNDEVMHRYIFTLFALDVDRLPLEGRFGGAQVREAMSGHVLAQASLLGRYALNPDVSQ